MLVPVADGSEEIEAVSIVDTLVRAGAAVTMASVEPRTLQVTCSRGCSLERQTAFLANQSQSWMLSLRGQRALRWSARTMSSLLLWGSRAAAGSWALSDKSLSSSTYS